MSEEYDGDYGVSGDSGDAEGSKGDESGWSSDSRVFDVDAGEWKDVSELERGLEDMAGEGSGDDETGAERFDELVRDMGLAGHEKFAVHGVVCKGKEINEQQTQEFYRWFKHFNWFPKGKKWWASSFHWARELSHGHVVHICQRKEGSRGGGCYHVRDIAKRVDMFGYIFKWEYKHELGPEYFRNLLLYLQKGGRQLCKVRSPENDRLEAARNDRGEMEATWEDYVGHSFCSGKRKRRQKRHYDYSGPAHSTAPKNARVSGTDKGDTSKTILTKKVKEIILVVKPLNEEELHHKGILEAVALQDVYFRNALYNETYWNQIYKKAESLAYYDWNRLTFSEKLEWHLNNKEYNDYIEGREYYEVEKSTEIIKCLIMEQYDYDVSRCVKFFDFLFLILNKQMPKVNTLYIKSPPGSGKNYFLDLVDLIAWTTAKAGKMNKTNNFSLMDCIGMSLLFLNEPNIDPGKIQDLKQLFEGDPIAIDVKHKPKFKLGRIPCIVATNVDIWWVAPHEKSAIMQRIVRTEWKPQPWLKQLRGHPTPHCLKEFEEKYKDWSFWINVQLPENFSDNKFEYCNEQINFI